MSDRSGDPSRKHKDGSRREKRKEEASGGTRTVIVLVGVIIIVGGAAAIVLQFMKPGDDFENVQVQFQSEIEIDGDGDELMEWDDEFADLGSEKSEKLVQSFKAKLITAMEAEGIKVDEVEVTGLEKTPPVDLSLNVEQTRDSISSSGPSGARNYKQLKRNRVSHVLLKYKTMGKASDNAATFASARESVWTSVNQNLATRLSSAGLQAKVTKPLKPEEAFSGSVEKAVENHAYDITTPKIDPQESEVCDCHTTAFGKVSPENPSIICDCYSGCSSPTGRSTYYLDGGFERGLFTLKTSICAAARYTEIINDDGGYVEAVYSGIQNVKVGPDKGIEGFVMGTIDLFVRSFTVKDVGSVIKATQPPTTADPSIGGFFKVRTTTLNPFVVHNPGRQFVKKFANPPIVLSIHISTLDGKPLNYNELFVTTGQNPGEQNDRVNSTLKNIEKKVTDALSGLPLSKLVVKMTTIDVPPDEDKGVVCVATLNGKIEEAVNAIVYAERTGKLYPQVERGLQSIGKLVSLRFSVDLLSRLRQVSRKRRSILRLNRAKVTKDPELRFGPRFRKIGK